MDKDDLELEELRAQERYRKALARHPDPRDPDHPEPNEYGFTLEEVLAA